MFNIASLASPVNVVKKAGNKIISNVFLKVFEVCVWALLQWTLVELNSISSIFMEYFSFLEQPFSLIFLDDCLGFKWIFNFDNF